MKNLTSLSNTSYLYIVLLHFLITYPSKAQWIQQGPGPSTEGQVENILNNNDVVGAVQCVTPHPTNADILYIGAVNGGVWRTLNATDFSPKWEFVSSNLSSLSIGALEFDPADATNQTLIVGFGYNSSFLGLGVGERGIYRTTNGADSWTNIDPAGTFSSLNITGIAAQGATIVVSTPLGIYRTTDTGTNWNHLNLNASSGLPSLPLPAFDIVQHPTSPTTLFTHAGNNGIYMSIDVGETWTKISDATVDAALGGTLTNVKLAVGSANNLFVGIISRTIDSNGDNFDFLSGLFRTLDGGNSWTNLELPQTIEGTTPSGIHAGGQGTRHFSIINDPNNVNVVYVGGDRQPIGVDQANNSIEAWPNSIGAENYTGRLFRVNAALPMGSQAAPITHNGTARNTAPHADSRDMSFDANGDLIEGDDGGVYKQSSPIDGTGDWSSLNGNLNVAEIHSSDWDAVSNIIISGLQDNGITQQNFSTNNTWQNKLLGDGGDVAVDDISSDTSSTRYFSTKRLGDFRREVYNSANVFQNSSSLSLINTATNSKIDSFSFVNPIKLNSQNGQWLLVSTANGLFESIDQGNTVTQVPGFNGQVNDFGRDAIAYGTSDNPEIIYAGASDSVLIRTVSDDSLVVSAAYSGGNVRGITLNPDNSQEAFVIDNNQVFRTTNTGTSWTDITSNLGLISEGDLLSIVYIPKENGNDWLGVGTELGFFFSSAPNFNTWSTLTPLPKAPVYDLEYDAADKILLAATMGRGTWTMNFSERDPVNVVLALDFSGSMLNNACPTCDPKIDVLKQSVEIFMQLWKGLAVTSDRIGVVYFQTNVESYGVGNTEFLFSTIYETDEMIADINARTATYGELTAMGGGLQQAINGLSNASRPKNIILFTDGVQNVSPGIVFPDLTIENGVFDENSNVSATSPLTQLNTDLGIKVNTIGVGATPAFETQLEDIARGTGGITKITTAPDEDLRQFFVEELVDVLRDFSPQLVDYRKNTFINYANEVFNVNSSTQKVIFKVSYDVGDKVIVNILKGDEDITSFANVTTGDFYQIFSIPFEKLLLLQGPEYIGSWQVFLESEQKIDYEIALIADEAVIDYNLSVGGPYRVGNPLKLSAELFVNDILTYENIKVTASIESPKEGLGNLLSTIPVEGKSPILLEPNQKLGAQKLARLFQNKEFLQRIIPENNTIELEPESDRVFRASFDNTLIPGNYIVTFKIMGTHPFTGSFERIEQRSVIVRFGNIDMETSKVNISKQAAGTSVIWKWDFMPIDKFGNYLGPDFGDLLQIQSPDGDVQNIVDNGDGSYSFEIVTNPGVEPDVKIEVY